MSLYSASVRIAEIRERRVVPESHKTCHLCKSNLGHNDTASLRQVGWEWIWVHFDCNDPEKRLEVEWGVSYG